MRHGKRINHLSRKSAHRKAMLANMACSLIEHKRITTTVAKAKALRQYVEPVINRSKTDSTHSRRMVFRYLRDKGAVTELFRNVAPAISNREGGYTRIIKTGFRPGDAADMCMIELVDFNDVYTLEKKKKSRRSRRGGAKKIEGGAAAAAVATEAKDAAEEATAVAKEATEEVAETADAAVETTEAAVEEVTETVEEVAAEATETAEEVAEEGEEATDAAGEAKEASEEDSDEEGKKDE